MAYITPQDTIQIQRFIAEWINSNLDDPYIISTGRTRLTLATTDDFRLQKLFPIIQIDSDNFSPTKITQAKKANYLEEEEHNLMIYYVCKKGQAYTFADNDLQLSGEAQVIKYLQYIRTQIKENITYFNTYFNRATFGTISKPVFNKLTSLYVSRIPLTVYTYRR